jgi:P-type Cu2+ transporter
VFVRIGSSERAVAAVREESREPVFALQARGIEVAMLTGEARAVADAVAEKLGIETV